MRDTRMRDMDTEVAARSDPLVTGWSALIGIVLIAAGVLGFLDTTLVGENSDFFPTDTLHDIVHIVTGVLALAIAFGLRGRTQADALIAFGVLYVVIFLAMLASPDLFGLMTVSANATVHVVHGVLAIGSLGIGYLARSAGRQATEV